MFRPLSKEAGTSYFELVQHNHNYIYFLTFQPLSEACTTSSGSWHKGNMSCEEVVVCVTESYSEKCGIKFQFGFWKTRSWFGRVCFGSVWNMQFGWDIIVIYYSCNSWVTWVVNLRQITYYSITAMLNELCMPLIVYGQLLWPMTLAQSTGFEPARAKPNGFQLA